MPNRRKSSSQRAPPKLFRCSGYGNCDMVFTRSEHLARHERKHTGEKPYKCIVPGCARMFSRFDNMMQHTQTHEKSKKVVPTSDASTPLQGNMVPSPSICSIKAEPLSPIKTESTSWNGQLGSMSDLIMATSIVPPPPPPVQPSMIYSRILPMPTRRASFSTQSSAPYPTSSYRLSHPHDVQSHFSNNDVLMQTHNIPRNRSSWPVRRGSYQSNHYAPSLFQQQYAFEEYQNDTCRRSSVSTHSSDSSLLSPLPYQYPQEANISRRRISIDDLRLPIEHLRNIQLDEKNHQKHYDNNTVDISSAEYEALEGFSKFHSNPIIARESPSPITETPSPISRHESPTIAAQVCAMRQRGLSTNESFLRR